MPAQTRPAPAARAGNHWQVARLPRASQSCAPLQARTRRCPSLAPRWALGTAEPLPAPDRQGLEARTPQVRAETPRPRAAAAGGDRLARAAPANTAASVTVAAIHALHVRTPWRRVTPGGLARTRASPSMHVYELSRWERRDRATPPGSCHRGRRRELGCLTSAACAGGSASPAGVPSSGLRSSAFATSGGVRSPASPGPPAACAAAACAPLGAVPAAAWQGGPPAGVVSMLQRSGRAACGSGVAAASPRAAEPQGAPPAPPAGALAGVARFRASHAAAVGVRCCWGA